MKHRILQLFLCAVFAVVLLSAPVAAATDGDFTYSVNSGNATITDYTGSAANLTIPSTLGGYPVTIIDADAFIEHNGLTAVIIPNSVTVIGNDAFYRCKGLTAVTIGNSVTDICFGAFCGCASLTSVTIPDSVTNIGGQAFTSCKGLTSVTIGNSVTDIGDMAFFACTGLTAINVDNSNSSYKSIDGVLFSKDGTKLVQYPGGKAGVYTIPNSVTEISDGAFPYCTVLTSITIPDSVTDIGNNTFYGCTGLTSVTIGNGVTDINGAFNGCTGLTSITIPDSVTDIGGCGFYGCTGLTSITIPCSVTDIGDDAFHYCTGLTSITIPNSVTDIGDQAFYACTGLTSITIPNSVIDIGDRAFYGCSGLTSVTIPNGVTDIGWGAFSHCTRLTSITIPNSITYIGGSAFLDSPVTIMGFSPSYAETYANNYSIPFIATNTLYSSPATYLFRVIDAQTENGIASATVSCDGKTVITDQNGYAKINLGSNIVADLEISASGYTTSTNKNQDLTPTKTNVFSLSGKSSISIPSFSAGEDTLVGPNVNFLGEDFDLFSFPMKIEIKLGKYVETKYNSEDNTTEIIINANRQDADKDFNKKYGLFKNVYDQIRNGNGNKVENLLSSLPKNTGNLVFDGSIVYGGFGKYDNNTHQWIEFGVIVKAKVDISRSIPFAYVCYFKPGLKGETEAKVYPVSSDGTVFIQNEISLKVTPYAGLGVGISNYLALEVGLEGEIKGTYKNNPSSTELRDCLTVKGNFSVYAKAVALLFQAKKNWIFFNYSLYPKAEVLRNQGIEVFSDSSLDSMQLMPRDYLMDRENSSSKIQTEDYSGAYKEDIFPEAEPQLIELSDGRFLMVWVEDDASRSSENRTELHYAIYDGSSWSAESVVNDDNTADFSPRLVKSGDKVYLLWQNADKVFDSSVTASEMCAHTTLCVSSFDGTGFSEPVQIDSAGSYQQVAAIAADGDNVAVAWIENSENDIFMKEGTNTIYRASYSADGGWEQPVAVASDLSCTFNLALGYVNGEPQIAYTIDMDGDLSTGDDTEIYTGTKDNFSRLTDNDSSETGIQYVNGNLYWNDGTSVQKWDGTTVSDLGVSVSGDFTYLQNGDNAAIISYENGDDFKRELCLSKLDGNTWTSPVTLTSLGKYIRSASVLLQNDGDIAYVANALTSQKIENDGDDPFGNADLYASLSSEKGDLIVNDTLYCDQTSVTPGGTIDLTATVTNNSINTINTLNVTDPDGAQKEVSANLAPGASTEVTVSYTVPTKLARNTVSVSINLPDGNETDLTNNTATTEIGLADLAFKDATVDATGKVTCTLVNQGYDKAENINVSLSESSSDDALSTKNIDSLDAGESQKIEFSVDPDLLTLANEDLVKILLLNATTTSDDAYLSNNSEEVVYKAVRVESVSVNHSELSLAVGQSDTLSACVSPETAMNANIVWLSNQTDVATVDSDGKITAKEAGAANITAVSEDGSFTATCAVTVTGSSDIKVTGVTLNKDALSLTKGTSESLTATVAPETASNKTVTWSSDKPTVATVDTTGKVTAVTAGNANITVETEDGNFTTTCAVTVTDNTVKVTGVSLNKDTLSLTKGNTDTLTATVAPDSATDQNVTWSSDKPSVATVDSNGKVTAIDTGNSIITVKTEDGNFTASCAVTVSGIPVTNITLNKNLLFLMKGSSESLTATISPDDAANKNVTWYSTAPSIATVDSNGKVTAVTAGNATITAKTADGNFTANCVVTVSNIPVSGITLNRNTLPLTKGNSETLTASVSPDNATDKSITWSSDKPSVATVDGNGKVTAVATGKATITVKAVDGNFTATCAVSVTTSIAFTDVPAKSWYEGFVNDLVGQGILTGYKNNDGTYSFCPDNTITRAEFATILTQASGDDLSSYVGKTSFNDVATDFWGAKFIEWAFRHGIVSGKGDGVYQPNANITRQEMALMIYNYATKYKGLSLPQTNAVLTFTDNGSIASWSATAVSRMQQAGIINGIANGDGTYRFDPTGNATRAEAATMISIFLKIK